jgi:hypothetical protein
MDRFRAPPAGIDWRPMVATFRRWAEPRTGPLLFLATTALYLAVGPWRPADSFAPLADAFLHGRLYVTEALPTLEMVPTVGGLYSPFPPVPALPMIPFVAVLGTGLVDTNWTSAIAGGLAACLMWSVLLRLGLERPPARWMAAAFAFGSELLYVGATGGQHHWPQVLALCLALAAFRLALDGRWPFLAGLVLGLAAGCRVPAVLAAPLFVAIYAGRPGNLRPIGRLADLRAMDRSSAVRSLRFLAGLALPLVAVGWYNTARFGSPLEFGYGLIVSQVDGRSVLSEPWYAQGIESLSYLPRNLYAMLFRSFDFVEQAPWLRPSWMGASILLTMPALAYLLRARLRDPLVAWCLAAAGLTLVPDLLHGAVGFAQFGYRFILDALPYLWVALALTMRERLARSDRLARAALLAGLAVNAYGLAAIWGLGFVSY